MDELEHHARELERTGKSPPGFYDWLASPHSRLPSEGDEFTDRFYRHWRFSDLRWEMIDE